MICPETCDSFHRPFALMHVVRFRVFNSRLTLNQSSFRIFLCDEVDLRRPNLKKKTFFCCQCVDRTACNFGGSCTMGRQTQLVSDGRLPASPAAKRARRNAALAVTRSHNVQQRPQPSSSPCPLDRRANELSFHLRVFLSDCASHEPGTHEGSVRFQGSCTGKLSIPDAPP